jgi:DNA-directed RNA polymerase specialized sigma24 family protein
MEAGDASAWEEFVRRFRPVTAGTVLRTPRRFGSNAPELFDDLVQETFLEICADRCRILREFKPQAPDSLFGLLKTVAFSVAQDHFRSSLAAKRGAGAPDAALNTRGEIPGRESANHSFPITMLSHLSSAA